MSHDAQRIFCQRVKAKCPDRFKDKRVLDVGSRNVNGTNRHLFAHCFYYGIDATKGPNVDEVVIAHRFQGSGFDVAISTEMLEHDPFAYATIYHLAASVLKPNGLLIFTAAGPERGEHGTAHSKPEDCPDLPWPNWYCPMTEDKIRAALNLDSLFREYAFESNKNPGDIYFWALTK